MMGTIGREIHRALGQIRLPFLGRIKKTGVRIQVAGLPEELMSEVRVFQQCGFASGLPLDAEVVMLPLNGKTARCIVVASAGGTVTVAVSEGETCIYDQFGHQILMKADGIHVIGDLKCDGDVISKGISLTKHIHPGTPPQTPGEFVGPPQRGLDGQI